MKNIIFYCLFLLQALVSQASTRSQNVEYSKADSILVVKLLKEAKTGIGTEHPMIYFGKKFQGVPYVAHTLEGGEREHLIVNLHELDCTTFVETVLALSLCYEDNLATFEDYCKKLTFIRYRGGKMTDYTSRLHYFTWWMEDNEKKGVGECVCPEKYPEGKAVFTARQTLKINYMSQHPNSYRQLKNNPSFISKIKKLENETNGEVFPYIPKNNVGKPQSSALGVIHDGDILSMLTSKAGLDTSHIGIAVWKNGKLHCMNASAVYKKVVIDTKTFYDYQQVQTSQTGIRVFRMNQKAK